MINEAKVEKLMHKIWYHSRQLARAKLEAKLEGVENLEKKLRGMIEREVSEKKQRRQT